MLQKNTAIHLHTAMRARITNLNLRIENVKETIVLYDRGCDINKPETMAVYEILNYYKNRYRRLKNQLHKSVLINKKLKMCVKNNVQIRFTNNELEYLLSVYKNNSIDNYYRLRKLKRDMKKNYINAIPGTNRGLYHFLSFKMDKISYAKILKNIKKFESVVNDLKNQIQFGYKLNNIGYKSESKSLLKIIKKKIGYIKHNFQVGLN